MLKIPKLLIFTSLLSCSFILCIDLQKRVSSRRGSDSGIVISCVNCSATNEALRLNVYGNFSCYAKTWNRRFSSANFVLYLKRPMTELFFLLKFYRKDGSSFRETIRTPVVDICKVFRETDNYFLKELTEILRSIFGNVIHPCPYESFVAYNVTIPYIGLLKRLISGSYMATIVLWTDEKQATTFTLNVLFSYASQ